MVSSSARYSSAGTATNGDIIALRAGDANSWKLAQVRFFATWFHGEEHTDFVVLTPFKLHSMAKYSSAWVPEPHADCEELSDILACLIWREEGGVYTVLHPYLLQG